MKLRFRMKTELYGYEVSTVELPSAYDGLKLGVYETMIRGYKDDWLDFEKRSNTHEDAIRDHNEGIEFVTKTVEAEMFRQKEKEGMISELERDAKYAGKEGNL